MAAPISNVESPLSLLLFEVRSFEPNELAKSAMSISDVAGLERGSQALKSISQRPRCDVCANLVKDEIETCARLIAELAHGPIIAREDKTKRA